MSTTESTDTPTIKVPKTLLGFDFGTKSIGVSTG